jgi:flagellar hook-associated protein FlgK
MNVTIVDNKIEITEEQKTEYTLEELQIMKMRLETKRNEYVAQIDQEITQVNEWINQIEDSN